MEGNAEIPQFVEVPTATGGTNIEECPAAASSPNMDAQPAAACNDFGYKTESKNSKWANHGAPHLKVVDKIHYYHPTGVAGKKESL